ncbi:hypothetical protein SQ03_31485, partial [Methylobacterium platani JCM 14648]
MLTMFGVSGRISAGFAVIGLILIALASFSIIEMRQISAGLGMVNDVNSVKQRYAINFRGSVHDRAIGLRDVVLMGEADLKANLGDIARLEQQYAASAVKLDEMMATGDATAMVWASAALMSARTALSSAVASPVAIISSSLTAEAALHAPRRRAWRHRASRGASPPRPRLPRR